MFHRLVIERLFTLGNYKNIKIIAETSGIPDEIWLDADQMVVIRDNLEKEIMASFSRHLMIMEQNAKSFKDSDYAEIYRQNS